MRVATLALALISASPAVHAGISLKHLQYDRRFIHAQNAEAMAGPLNDEEALEPTQWNHLNAKTKKYAVDGNDLPQMMPAVAKGFGESYAGLMPIGNNKNRELFFWYFPSENPAAKDEITIWLNGGPGCSSLDGLFHENGPVIWQAGTYRPTRNTYTWRNLTNMVWVEQPVGTGFSTGTPTARDEVDVATQFRGFWENFVDMFDLHNRKVYVTGESYAGQYVPYIADGFLNQTNKKYYDVHGILIYDPSIGYDSITEDAPAVAFVDANPGAFPFNDTFMADIHKTADECGYTEFLEKGLVYPPPQKGLPSQPGTDGNGHTRSECRIFNKIINAAFEINPCFDIYLVYQACPLLWDTLGFPYSSFYLPPGYNQPYFNHTAVKKAIHAPLDTNWEICASRSVFVGGDRSLPSAVGNGPLKRVTEKTNKVIVSHGALDMVLIANGTLLTLNNMTWNGARGFHQAPTKPFYVPYHYEPNQASVAGAGVYGSWVTSRGLTYVSVDFSGHEVPEYQPSAAYRHLEFLLGRIKSLSEVSAFTTQPGFPQSHQPLGKGTGPEKVLHGRGANVNMATRVVRASSVLATACIVSVIVLI